MGEEFPEESSENNVDCEEEENSENAEKAVDLRDVSEEDEHEFWSQLGNYCMSRQLIINHYGKNPILT